MFWKVWQNMSFAQVRFVYTVFVYTRDSSLNSNFNTLDPDWLQHDHHTSYGVTQQYFSATFISLLFHSHKEKFGVFFFKMLLLKFLFYFF